MQCVERPSPCGFVGAILRTRPSKYECHRIIYVSLSVRLRVCVCMNVCMYVCTYVCHEMHECCGQTIKAFVIGSFERSIPLAGGGVKRLAVSPPVNNELLP